MPVRFLEKEENVQFEFCEMLICVFLAFINVYRTFYDTSRIKIY